MTGQPAPDVRKMMPAIAVTIAALLVYRLGSFLPLPGIRTDAGITGPAGQRLSLFALDLIPVLSAWLLLDAWELVVSAFRGAVRQTSVERSAFLLHQTGFNRRLSALSLAIAALQAYGIAVALEAMPQLAVETGFAFKVGIIVSLVGGTAVLLAMAELISRHGVGHGTFILLSAGLLAGLLGALAQVVEFARMYALSASALIAFGVAVLAALAGLVCVALARFPNASAVTAPVAQTLAMDFTGVIPASTAAGLAVLMAYLILPQSSAPQAGVQLLGVVLFVPMAVALIAHRALATAALGGSISPTRLGVVLLASALVLLSLVPLVFGLVFHLPFLVGSLSLATVTLTLIDVAHRTGLIHRFTSRAA